MTSTGSANVFLPYPDVVRYGWKRAYRFTDGGIERDGLYRDRKTPRESPSHWRKFINLCKMLKRTGADYSVEFIDMGEHCRAFVKWRT